MILVIWLLQFPRKFFRFVARKTRLSIAAILLILYLLGALLMPLFEGPESMFASLPDYTWWFVVTATTVGYGDISPMTSGGRLVAMVIMLLGIGVIAVAVASLAESMFDLGRKRMKGLSRLDEKNHLVIFGYTQGVTEELVREIHHDKSSRKTPTVLCSSRTEENPMPDRVQFIKGNLTSHDLLARACVGQAGRIIVHGKDDNETLMVALAARSVNSSAHIVVQLDKPETELHIKRIDSQIECVTPLAIPLIVQAIQDQGATAVINALLSNVQDDTLYRLDIPSSQLTWNFGELQQFFKDRFGVTLIAVATLGEVERKLKLNPASDFQVLAGASLFYIAPERLDSNSIDWSSLE